jgi:hypothetical protein
LPFAKGKGGWGDRDIETPGTSIHSETHNDFLLFENDLQSVSEHTSTSSAHRSVTGCAIVDSAAGREKSFMLAPDFSRVEKRNSCT